MMKTKQYFIFAIVSIILFGQLSCKKDHISEPIGHSVAFPLNSFPLSIGNYWKYSTEIRVYTQTGFLIYTIDYIHDWEIISDTMIAGFQTSKMSRIDSSLTDSSVNSAMVYYTNQPDGFFGVAYDGNIPMIDMRSSSNKLNYFSCFGINPEYNQTDTLIVFNDYFRILKFPSNPNDIWSPILNNNMLVGKRKWLGYSTITTPAGTFNCIKLEIFTDSNNDNLPDTGQASTFQYFSDKGLIREETIQALTFGCINTVDTMKRVTNLVLCNF